MRLTARQFLTTLLLPLFLFAGPPITTHQSPVASYSVHEWGTFTSIAGPDGLAMNWLPLTGSTNLPNFVEHLTDPGFKGGLRGTVRMETPVLYFYSPRELTASVHVSFAKGLITEWYPRAAVPALDPRNDLTLAQKHTEGAITWRSVHIQPGTPADFPTDASRNHYYAARQTSSAPLTVDTSAGPQRERFLFYRGVSAFLPPLTATLSPDGAVRLQNHLATNVNRADSSFGNSECSGSSSGHGFSRAVTDFRETRLQPLRASFFAPEKSPSKSKATARLHPDDDTETIPNVILFERRGSKLGYRVLGPLKDEASLAPPVLDGSLEFLFSTLEGMLISQGLYPDEAHAMLETWKDSWFEEGSRIIYIVPRPFVDSVLPLTISPAPTEITRVFVGRLELVTPATEHAVESAFASRDRATLAKYNRFLEPILYSMIQQSADDSPRQRLLFSYLDSVNLFEDAEFAK